MLRDEVVSRLRFLEEVGLAYLSLDRPTRTLSGGEIERVNLTTCLGASLVNTLFVLDEPSIGLHPRDIRRLIRVMKTLRDKGNTLLVVEHEEAVIRSADHLIELGPGRGDAGGELVFSGPLTALPSQRTLTADYLSRRKSIPVPARRRAPRGWLRVEGASAHNLRGIDVDFPLGVVACITGVSGSGKSTLLHHVLYGNLARARHLGVDQEVGACRALHGVEQITQVVMIDQSPLARTPRSTPAVYLGVFDAIRELFAATPAALAQGLTPGAFSFNTGAGEMGSKKSRCNFSATFSFAARNARDAVISRTFSRFVSRANRSTTCSR
jgi:excinuclease ABC subunit A